MNNAQKLEVRIGSLVLKNPVMPASGAFGEDMHEVIDFNKLGAIVPKSITKYARRGNPVPRVCETPGGMINSIGIQSKGIDYYLSHIIPFYREFETPVISSISADSIEEFAEMCSILNATDGVDGLELNISCPNLKQDGQAYGMDPEVTYKLVSKVKGETNVPVIVKLTPNVTSIQEIAIAADEAGADAINVANTFLAMSIDIHSRKPKIGQGMGGISGPAIRPMIVRMVYQANQVVSIPIIGCGGIMNGADAIEMILAGATAVQVGTASFINPYALQEVLDGITDYMRKYNIEDINDLVGKVMI